MHCWVSVFACRCLCVREWVRKSGFALPQTHIMLCCFVGLTGCTRGLHTDQRCDCSRQLDRDSLDFAFFRFALLFPLLCSAPSCAQQSLALAQSHSHSPCQAPTCARLSFILVSALLIQSSRLLFLCFLLRPLSHLCLTQTLWHTQTR